MNNFPVQHRAFPCNINVSYRSFSLNENCEQKFFEKDNLKEILEDGKL